MLKTSSLKIYLESILLINLSFRTPKTESDKASCKRYQLSAIKRKKCMSYTVQSSIMKLCHYQVLKMIVFKNLD